MAPEGSQVLHQHARAVENRKTTGLAFEPSNLIGLSPDVRESAKLRSSVQGLRTILQGFGSCTTYADVDRRISQDLAASLALRRIRLLIQRRLPEGSQRRRWLADSDNKKVQVSQCRTCVHVVSDRTDADTWSGRFQERSLPGAVACACAILMASRASWRTDVWRASPTVTPTMSCTVERENSDADFLDCLSAYFQMEICICIIWVAIFGFAMKWYAGPSRYCGGYHKCLLVETRTEDATRLTRDFQESQRPLGVPATMQTPLNACMEGNTSHRAWSLS
jgi:hypothetical protein